jgi:hypothetical protein
MNALDGLVMSDLEMWIALAGCVTVALAWKLH